MDTIEASHAAVDIRTRLRCPSWSEPIVGTKPTDLPARRCSFRQARTSSTERRAVADRNEDDRRRCVRTLSPQLHARVML